MFVPPFQMHVASSAVEALQLRSEFGDQAALYCGGTELLLVMKLGFTELTHLIDIKHVDELRSVTIDDAGIRIGAAVTYREIERNSILLADRPEFVSMISGIANLRVRSVGTLGGNLAFADPASDPATYLLAVNGEVEVCALSGQRRIVPMADFYLGPYQPAMGKDEMIVGIRIPRVVPRSVVIHERMKLRERPNITVAVFVSADGGKIREARVAIGSIGLVPRQIFGVDQSLIGAEIYSLDECLRNSSVAAVDGIALYEDPNGSIEYKRHLLQYFVTKVARRAIEEVLN